MHVKCQLTVPTGRKLGDVDGVEGLGDEARAHRVALVQLGGHERHVARRARLQQTNTRMSFVISLHPEALRSGLIPRS